MRVANERIAALESGLEAGPEGELDDDVEENVDETRIEAVDPEALGDELDASNDPSSMTQTGIDDVLEAIVKRLPAPKPVTEGPTRAILFDAQYDAYRGVVMLVRVREGTLRKGQELFLMHSEKTYTVEELATVLDLSASTVSHHLTTCLPTERVNSQGQVSCARTSAGESKRARPSAAAVKNPPHFIDVIRT